MSFTDLQGRVALVTGAGSGLGEATAMALGHEGVRVTCLDVRADGAERTCRSIQESGGSALAVACDVSRERDVELAIQESLSRFGRVDIVVNNAAIDFTLSVDEMSIDQWDRVVGVNLRGPFLMAKAAFPHFKSQGSGHVINVASTAATRAWANAAAYHATKWGLRGFSRALGVEGRPLGIRVTTIIPGGMQTHFFDRFESEGIPMPDPSNLQDPANVAQLIVWALRAPSESVLQEAILTPVSETSWP